MSTNIYIGLYKNIPHRKFLGIWHWNITVTESFPEPADVYSVVENAGVWEKSHRTKAARVGVLLIKSNNLFSLIRLPAVSVSREELETFLRSQSPLQGDTPLVTRRGEWSCAQWVIRALQEIDARGWFSETPTKLSDRTAFYEHVRLLRGANCEIALENKWNSEEDVGVVQNSIRVLQL